MLNKLNGCDVNEIDNSLSYFTCLIKSTSLLFGIWRPLIKSTYFVVPFLLDLYFSCYSDINHMFVILCIRNDHLCSMIIVFDEWEIGKYARTITNYSHLLLELYIIFFVVFIAARKMYVDIMIRIIECMTLECMMFRFARFVFLY